MLLTSSKANSAAGWQAWPPCHPPLPPIGNIPPICNSSNPWARWYSDAGSRAANKNTTIQCNDTDLVEEFSRRRRLTHAPNIFDEQMLPGTMNTWSIPVISIFCCCYCYCKQFYSECCVRAWAMINFLYISICFAMNIRLQKFIANQRFQEDLRFIYSRSKFCNDDVLKIDFYFRHFYIHEFVRFSTYSPVRMNGFFVQVIFPFVSALLVLNDSIAWIRVRISYLRCKKNVERHNNDNLGQNFDKCANIPIGKKWFTSKFNYHKVSFGWDLKKKWFREEKKLRIYLLCSTFFFFQWGKRNE